jgi:putative ABC transport system permease protein
MRWFESWRISFRALASNKLRAGLTMLGIIIGVAAVIALLSVGQGASAEITRQVQGIGSNVIFVVPGRINQQGVRSASGAATTLSFEDALAMQNSACCPDVKAVAPLFSGAGQVIFQGNNTNTQISGTTPDYESVRNFHAKQGRFIEQRDLDTSARVAVLGKDVVKVLFVDQDPLGQTIKINRVPFKVVGVMEEKGASGFFGQSQDDVVYIPFTTAQARLYGTNSATPNGQRRVSSILVSVTAEPRVDATISQVTQLLRDRHQIQYQQDDFSVLSQKDLLGALSQITNVLTIFLGAIAAISLLVGGIGIMNIMLVSVTERTREIGIRKAVGAKRGDILIQFLVEAITLSISGGFVGILIGGLISQVVNSFKVLTTVVSIESVVLAVGFAVAVGLFFGLYPAWRASLLNPIDALRYE